jgi:release factor glutamine methyltransferase
LDAGTGSGCIGISIALKKTNFKVYGSDFSKDALDVASINKINLNTQNFFLINADWLSCFKNDSFDLILSNPPYISQNDLHLKDLTHEPKIALASNESGYSDIKKITQQSSKILKRRGILMIEHGYNQEKVVKSIFKDNYFSDICTIEDYQAHPRVTYGILNK